MGRTVGIDIVSFKHLELSKTAQTFFSEQNFPLDPILSQGISWMGQQKKKRAGPNYASTTTEKTKPTNGAHDESVDQVDEIENPNNPNWVSKSKYRKQINKHKRKLLTAIFNYSSIVLTDDMEELLNMGLNFAILPLNLDITQVLVDFKKYERSLVWKEF